MFASENHPKIKVLAEQLNDFYDHCTTYDAFHGANYHPLFWQPIKDEIERKISASGSCRILEFGCGCTNFAEFLGSLREKVIFDVQDVTDRNRNFLEARADHIYVGSIETIQAKYDVIFSTFVWEHTLSPAKSLNHLLSLLNSQGSLFLTAPRYDLPFYISPSAGHLKPIKRLAISLWLVFRRLKVLLSGKADFLLHLDPAVLHRPYFRDADAVHWVSLWDLKAALPKTFKLRQMDLQLNGWYGQAWAKFALLFVEIKKQPSAISS